MKRNSGVKITLLLVIAVISVFSMTSCFFLDPFMLIDGTTEKELELAEPAKMSYTYDEQTELYNVRIEGLAKNTKEYDMSGGFVSVSVYDKDGNSICTAEDYISFIEVGGTWRFSAVATSYYEPSSFNIRELYGYKW